MNRINRILLSTLLCTALFSTNIFSQENPSENQLLPYLDPESTIALQTVPIYDGVEEFKARVEKIRKEENREPLGLVLCGGSARAFCHIGVLKAMEENKIKPDFIIANSMGAIIGSLYGYGFSPAKIEEIVSEISLSQYFETVFPIHGGMISVRKYEAFINTLLGDSSHDLKDCMIPVLLLSEDLATKRQIWHGKGDFASVMDAAFAMSFFMEPVDYTLSDGTKVKLVDSGTVDIAGLKVARSFSTNLIVSSAFYDVDVNLSNPIVVLNRTFSIGKERIALKDILDFKPLLIRNNVEHFSFMDFQKAAEITQAGYDSAYKVMPYLLQAPHGYKIDEEWRSKCDKLGDELEIKIFDEEPMKSQRPYFGAKVWPVFGVTDFPDSYLFDFDGVGLNLFEDLGDFFIKAQINQPFTFNEARAELLLRYYPSSVFKAELFGSYGLSYKNFENNNFFGYAGLSFCPRILPSWFKGGFLTGEITTDNNWMMDYLILTSGLKFDFGNKLGSSVFIKPFIFAAGQDFDSIHFGAGGEVQSSGIIGHFGFGENATIRYSANAIPFASDFYRAAKPDAQNDLIISSASELYFYTSSLGFTVAETLIFQQLKAGLFFDYLWTGNHSYCTGGFARTNVSLVGLADFILEAGGGWNFDNQKPFAYFQMKNRM